MSRSLLWYLTSDWFPMIVAWYTQQMDAVNPNRTRPVHGKTTMDEINLGLVDCSRYLPLLGDCPAPELITFETKVGFQFDRERFRPVEPRELDTDAYMIRNMTPNIDTTFACGQVSVVWNHNTISDRAVFGHRRDGGPSTISIVDMIRRHDSGGRLNGTDAITVKSARFSWTSEKNVFKDRGAAGPGEIILNNIRLGFQNGVPVEAHIGSMDVSWSISGRQFIINQNQNDFARIEKERGIRLNLLDDKSIFPNPTEQVIFASDVLS